MPIFSTIPQTYYVHREDILNINRKGIQSYADVR